MLAARRPARQVDALASGRDGKAELLGRDLVVMRPAEVAGVVVVVGAAQGERDGVVDDGRFGCPALIEA